MNNNEKKRDQSKKPMMSSAVNELLLQHFVSGRLGRSCIAYQSCKIMKINTTGIELHFHGQFKK